VIESDIQRGKVVETEDMTVSKDGTTMHVVDTLKHDNSVQHYDLNKSP
jgi:hypothetical protein